MTDGLTDRIDRCEELPVDDFAETLGRIRKLAEAKDQRDDATAVCIRIQALPDACTGRDGRGLRLQRLVAGLSPVPGCGDGHLGGSNRLLCHLMQEVVETRRH